ncbi:MAG: hypothetical protein GX102_14030, partial [Porphyromonadaceae bacterium]|nr:hypothetical protein [Porphyromonadaceae bacterium]
LILLLLSALLIVVGCKKTDPDILTPESLAGEWKRTGDAVGTEFWTLINTDGSGKVALFANGKSYPSFIQFHWESKGKILTLTDYATGEKIICEITKRTKDELKMNVTYPWDPGNKKQETWLKDSFKTKLATPHITLTTAKTKKDEISLYMEAADADRADVWIDLNNNGIKDPGESSINFESSKNYIINTPTVTLYGKITRLNCESNLITALDVSKNTVLTELYCYNNLLNELDISKNTALTLLECSNNLLFEFDVSKNTALTELYCYDNLISKLDVSKSTALYKLFCYNNKLTELIVSKNSALTILICSENKLEVATLHKIIDDLPERKDADKAEAYLYSNPGTNKITDAYKEKGKNKNWEIIYVAK